VILAASACRTSITEVYQSATKRAWRKQLGLRSQNAAAGGASKYVQLIQTDVNGKVTVTIQGFAPTTVSTVRWSLWFR